MWSVDTIEIFKFYFKIFIYCVFKKNERKKQYVAVGKIVSVQLTAQPVVDLFKQYRRVLVILSNWDL